MINLALYTRQSDYIEFLRKLSKQENNLYLIAPNPQVADQLRTLLPLAPTQTIQDFIKEETRNLFTPEELDNITKLKVKKSELILLLGFLWRATYKDEPFSQFIRAYTMLTDLRSLTLDEGAFDEILSEELDLLRHPVLFFHKFMQDNHYLDEHRMYYDLSEILRAGKLPKNYISERKICFFGFDYISALQLDFFQSLAIRNDIYLGIYNSVYQDSYSVDWVKWLDKSKLNLITIDGEMPKFEIQTYRFSKGRLSTLLLNYNGEVSKPKAYYLATKDFSFNVIQEIPSANPNFREKINIFEDYLKIFENELNSFIGKEKEAVTQFLNLAIKETISSDKFIQTKLVTLFKEVFEKYLSYIENFELTSFDIKLLLEVCKLDLPRINFMNITMGEAKDTINPIKIISSFDHNRINIVCAQQSYGKLLSGSSYPDYIEKKMSVYGPIRRGNFLFLSLKEQIKEALMQEGAALFIESNLEKEDLAWAKILEGATIVEPLFPTNDPVTKDYLLPNTETRNHMLSKISASKLQTYLECPRKYFYQYVENFNVDVKIKDDVSAKTKGIILHDILNKYISHYSLYDENKFKELIRATVDIKLKELEDVTNFYLQKKIEEEVFSYTKSSIELLLKINSYYRLSFEFEKPIELNNETLKYTGNIDYFSTSEKTIFCLDFKRTKSSIPQKSEIEAFKKIQILFYLKFLQNIGIIDNKRNIVFGYLNLEDPWDSILYTNSNEISSEIKELTGLKVSEIDVPTLVAQYEEFEASKIDEIRLDKHFKSIPASSSSCRFCTYRYICPKKEIHESSAK